MSNAKDIEIKLLKKTKEFTNGKTGEKFTTDTLEGYVTYKGIPVYKASGSRLEDKTYTAKATGKPFTVSKFRLALRNGEDYNDEELKEDGVLFLRLNEQTNRSKGNKFFTVTSEDHYYGKDDERNTKGFRIGNMLVPLNGIIESNTILDQWGDEAHKLNLETANKYAVSMITKDAMADEDVKIGYTASTSDELFTDEELEGLAKQFPYFDRFNGAFNGVDKAAEQAKEKVTPSSF